MNALNFPLLQYIRSGDRSHLDDLRRYAERELPGAVVGDTLALSRNDLDRLYAMMRKQGRDWVDYPHLLLIAAVFFVRFDYDYTSGGFWKPFLRMLELEPTQGNQERCRELLEEAFRRVRLFRPRGGYKYVSPLIYHSVLPASSIDNFAQAVARAQSQAVDWFDADPDELRDLLAELLAHAHQHLRRMLEGNPELLCDLFRDVCRCLSTGVDELVASDTGRISVSSIASRAQQLLDQDGAEYAPAYSAPYARWHWDRHNGRVLLLVRPFNMHPEDDGLRVGSRTFSIEKDPANPRRSLLQYIDGWYLDSAAPTIDLAVEGGQPRRRGIRGLGQQPLFEQSGLLVPIDPKSAAPAVCWWLLPPAVSPPESATCLGSEPAPVPLDSWRAELLSIPEGASWQFRQEGLFGTADWSTGVSRAMQWSVEEGGADRRVLGPGGVPVFRHPPSIKVPAGLPEDAQLFVSNLSSKEKAYIPARDQLEESPTVIRHERIGGVVQAGYGHFVLTIVDRNRRSIQDAPRLEYVYLPIDELELPAILLPEQRQYRVTWTIPEASRVRLSPRGESSTGSLGARRAYAYWEAQARASFMVHHESFKGPLHFEAQIPRISWELSTHPEKVNESFFVTENHLLAESPHLYITAPQETEPQLFIEGELVDDQRQFTRGRRKVALAALLNRFRHLETDCPELLLKTSKGSWPTVRFHLNVRIVDFKADYVDGCIEARVQLARRDFGEFFLAAARLDNIRDSLVRARIAMNTETGEGFHQLPLDCTGGRWIVCLQRGQSHELVLTTDGSPSAALFSIPGTARWEALEVLEPHQLLIQAARESLPLSKMLTSSEIRHKAPATAWSIAGELAAADSADEARRTMERLLIGGVNMACLAARPVRPEHVDRLLTIWHPAAIPTLCRNAQYWGDAARDIIGNPWDNPFFLPTGSIVRVGEGIFEVSTPALRMLQGGRGWTICRVTQDGQDRGLLVCNPRGKGAAVVDDAELRHDQEIDWSSLRRVKAGTPSEIWPGNTLPSVNSALCSDSHALPEPLGSLLIVGKAEVLATTHTAYSTSFLAKAILQWADNDSFEPALEHEDMQASFDLFRQQLGVDNMFDRHLFVDAVPEGARRLLIHLSVLVEERFCGNDANWRMRHAGFLFLVAAYNRLVARHADAGDLIVPENPEWLTEWSAQAFTQTRSLLDYWLTLTESILGWWGSTSTEAPLE